MFCTAVHTGSDTHHSYQTCLSLTHLQTLRVTEVPAETVTGLARGIKRGNQLNIPWLKVCAVMVKMMIKQHR